MTVKAEHFCIQEYVPPHIFFTRGERAWELIDSRLIETNDALRERFGPMIINTWHSPTLIRAFGLREWSGLRIASYYKTENGTGHDMYRRYDQSLSQHKYGRASDSLFRDVTGQEVREYVLANPFEFPHLTALEDRTTWFHGDVRNCEPVKVFRG